MTVLVALMRWLVGFTFTQVIEVPIYLRATTSWRVAGLASVWTHPIVWFVFPALFDEALGYWGMVALAELFAVVTEALWLRAARVPRALLISFLANTASAVGGLLLRQVFDAP